MTIGLLVIRVVLALILFTHATQKLFGWFSGNGLSKQGEIFASLGLRPGRLMVTAAGVSELLAAILLLVGFITPVGALIAAGTMTVAGVTMHVHSGNFWNISGGGEYPYVLAVFSAAMAFTGAGSLSLDAAVLNWYGIGYSWIVEPAPWVGLAVIILAATAAVPFAVLVKKEVATNLGPSTAQQSHPS